MSKDYRGYMFKTANGVVTTMEKEDKLFVLATTDEGYAEGEVFTIDGATLVRDFDIVQETPREGGQHLNFNVLNRETLLDAQEHPEKYPQLVLRVSGYSLFWNSATKEQQDEIISRTFTTNM